MRVMTDRQRRKASSVYCGFGNLAAVVFAIWVVGTGIAAAAEPVTDTTPEGMRFSEAMITSPGGHAILVYELTPAQ